MKITIRTNLPRKKKKRYKKALSKVSCAGLICWAEAMEQWKKLWINKMKGTGPASTTHKFSIPTGPQNGGAFIDSQPGHATGGVIITAEPGEQQAIPWGQGAAHPKFGTLFEAEPGYLLTTETDPKMLEILKRLNK